MKIATTHSLKLGDHLREWSSDLELPLMTFSAAFKKMDSKRSAVEGEAKSERGRYSPIPRPAWRISPQRLHPRSSSYTGDSFGEDSCRPESEFLVEVSNALASNDLGAKAGDLLELVRNDDKQRYEVGELAGSRYIKAHQGHSRPEVGTVWKRPAGTIAHGTMWHLYRSIQEQGLIPGDLFEIVRNDDKQRYEHIRARQGHSRLEVRTADLLENPGIIAHDTMWHSGGGPRKGGKGGRIPSPHLRPGSSSCHIRAPIREQYACVYRHKEGNFRRGGLLSIVTLASDSAPPRCFHAFIGLKTGEKHSPSWKIMET